MTDVPVRSCVGLAIRTLRKQQGLSARALSIKAGLSPAYAFKVERGAIEPSLRSFARLAVALGMNPGEVWVCVANEGSLETSHGSSIVTPAVATAPPSEFAAPLLRRTQSAPTDSSPYRARSRARGENTLQRAEPVTMSTPPATQNGSRAN